MPVITRPPRIVANPWTAVPGRTPARRDERRALPVLPSVEPVAFAGLLMVGPPPEWLLLEFGGQVAVAPSVDAAWNAVCGDGYRLLVIAPHVEGDADGVRFARDVKARAGQAWRAGGPIVRPGYGDLAFVLLPVPGDDQYAIYYSGLRCDLREGSPSRILGDIHLLLRDG
jgi:hypothetical protein